MIYYYLFPIVLCLLTILWYVFPTFKSSKDIESCKISHEQNCNAERGDSKLNNNDQVGLNESIGDTELGEELREKLNDLEIEMTEKNAILSRLQDLVSSMDTELSFTKENWRMVVIDRDEIKTEFEKRKMEISHDNKGHVTMYKKYEGKIKKLKDDAAKNKEEVENLNKKLEDTVKSKEDLNKRYDDIKVQMNDKVEDNDKLKKLNCGLQSTIDSLENSISVTLDSRKVESEHIIADREELERVTEMAQGNEKYKATIEKLRNKNKQNKQNKQKMEELTQELKDSAKELEKLKKRYDDIEDQMKNEVEDNDKLKKLCLGLQSTIDSLENSISVKDKDLSRKEDDVLKASSLLKSLQCDLDSQKVESEHIIADREEIKKELERVTEMAQGNEKYKVKVENMKSTAAKNKAQYVNLTQVIKDLEKRMEDLNIKCDEAKTSLLEKVEQLRISENNNNQLTGDIGFQRKEMEELKKEMAWKSEDFLRRKDELNDSHSKLKDIIDNLGNTIEDRVNEIGRLKAKESSLTGDVVTLRGAVDEFKKELNIKEEQLVSKDKEVMESNTRAELCITQLKNQTSSLEEVDLNKYKDMEYENEKLKEVIAELRRAICDKGLEINNLKENEFLMVESLSTLNQGVDDLDKSFDMEGKKIFNWNKGRNENTTHILGSDYNNTGECVPQIEYVVGCTANYVAEEVGERRSVNTELDDRNDKERDGCILLSSDKSVALGDEIGEKEDEGHEGDHLLQQPLTTENTDDLLETKFTEEIVEDHIKHLEVEQQTSGGLSEEQIVTEESVLSENSSVNFQTMKVDDLVDGTFQESYLEDELKVSEDDGLSPEEDGSVEDHIKHFEHRTFQEGYLEDRQKVSEGGGLSQEEEGSVEDLIKHLEVEHQTSGKLSEEQIVTEESVLSENSSFNFQTMKVDDLEERTFQEGYLEDGQKVSEGGRLSPEEDLDGDIVTCQHETASKSAELLHIEPNDLDKELLQNNDTNSILKHLDDPEEKMFLDDNQFLGAKVENYGSFFELTVPNPGYKNEDEPPSALVSVVHDCSEESQSKVEDRKMKNSTNAIPFGNILEKDSLTSQTKANEGSKKKKNKSKSKNKKK